jgi:pimeloyl-ACP methyl ester carboxylesterase
MATYVLVHGAWGGGWYWAHVARLLRSAGHEVFTPTLTGLGERSHLLGPDVGLAVHVEDILGVLAYERLEDVVLVGHSYGGMVISGVADRATERIGALVYLDAALPVDGQAMLDLLLPARRASLLESAQTAGDGWRVPPIPAAQWGIDDPADQAWLDSLCGPQPLKSFSEPIRLAGHHLEVPKKVYVLAARYNPSSFQQFAARTRADPAWTNEELPTFHFAMLERPQETAAVLLRSARPG